MQPVRIHVNQPGIRRNQAEGRTDYPVITIAREDRSDICRGVNIVAPDGTIVARLVYRPDEPMEPSGATVWIEVGDGCAAVPCDEERQAA